MVAVKASLAEAERQEQALQRRILLEDIQLLETRAHHLGLTVTGHALNNAKNAAGWEMAGNIELAGKAARGERSGE